MLFVQRDLIKPYLLVDFLLLALPLFDHIELVLGLGSLRSVILLLNFPLIFPIEDLLSNYGIVLRFMEVFLLNEEVALVGVHPLDVLLFLHGLH